MTKKTYEKLESTGGVVITPTNQTVYDYKYNSKEWQDELNLNLYDLGARMYDPAIGRFMIVDPLADLINYQSGYAFADNNPVLNVDEYGFGILRAIGNIFSRIGFGIKKVLTGGNCDCRQFQGESLRDAWNQPDFPGVKDFINDVFSGSGRPSPTNVNPPSEEPSDDNNSSRTKLSSITMNPIGPVVSNSSFNTSPLNIYPPANQTSVVNRPKPTFRGRVVDSNTTINLNITFMQSRFLVEPTDSNLKIINDLVKTLKEYPEISVIIYANMGVFGKDNNEVTDSDEGRMKVGNFKSQRANTILKILQANGIPASRIQTQPGHSHSMSVDVKFIHKK